MRIIRVLERIAVALEAQNIFEREILDANQRQHEESAQKSIEWLEWNKQNRAEDLELGRQNRADDLVRIAKEHANFMHSKELDRSVNLQIAEMNVEMQREQVAVVVDFEAKRDQEITKSSRPKRAAKATGPVVEAEK